MAQLFTDNARTTLAVSIGIGDTTLSVASGTGDNFPAVDGATGTDYFVITLEDASGNREFIRVDHRASGSDALGTATYPLQRGYDGSTARAWTAGDVVDLRWTSEAANRLSTGKADKVTGATSGNLAALDANGNLTDAGVAASAKADKVTGATSGNLAVLDASGNLTDAGESVAGLNTSIGAKADKVTGATNGNLAALDASGNLTDAGESVAGLNTSIGAKTDKVTGAISGNLAALDANGNLTDAGVAASAKADKVTGATSGNLAALDASGNLTDAGVAASAKADKLASATAGAVPTLDAAGNLAGELIPGAANGVATLDASGVLTAAQLGASALATSGYQKLPSGLIFQWGYENVSGGPSSHSFLFPIAFPTTTLVISHGKASRQDFNDYFSPVSTTGATVNQVNTGGVVPFYWFAIGY